MTALLLLIPGLWRATQGARTPRHDPQAGPTNDLSTNVKLVPEIVVATIYERSGHLRLRRRKP